MPRRSGSFHEEVGVVVLKGKPLNKKHSLFCHFPGRHSLGPAFVPRWPRPLDKEIRVIVAGGDALRSGGGVKYGARCERCQLAFSYRVAVRLHPANHVMNGLPAMSSLDYGLPNVRNGMLRPRRTPMTKRPSICAAPCRRLPGCQYRRRLNARWAGQAGAVDL
jgi:hypothetical protein